MRSATCVENSVFCRWIWMRPVSTVRPSSATGAGSMRTSTAFTSPVVTRTSSTVFVL